MKSRISHSMGHFFKTSSPSKSRLHKHLPTASDYVNILELLENRVLMDATSALVQLDSTFGQNGVAQPGMMVDANGNNEKLSYSTFTDAGNGQTYALEGQQTSWAGPNAFSLIKLNADGSLDPTFNSPQQSYQTPQPDPLPWSGFSLTDFIQPEAIKIQTDGKIIVVVRDIPVGPPDPFLVFRYNTDGSLDPTFGINGETIIPIDNAESDPSVFLTPDGKIDLIDTAGASRHWNFASSTWIPSDPTLFFRQLNSDGSMDASVGTNGVAASPLPALKSSFMADNHITLASLNSTYIGAIAAPGGGFSVYLDDSAATPSYDPATYIHNSFQTHDETTVVQVDSSGNLGTSSVITSSDHSYVYDPSTGSYVNGYVNLPTALQADGKLLVYSADANGILRYNSDGTLDSTFQTGAIQFGNGPSTNTLTKVLPQSDGKILTLSIDPSGTFYAMQRLNSDGTPDTTFANGQAIYSGTFPRISSGYTVIPPVNENMLNLFASVSNFTTMPDGSIMVGTYGGFGNAGAIAKITPSGGTANAYDVQAAVTNFAAAQAAQAAADLATAAAEQEAYAAQQAAIVAQQAADQVALAAADLAQNIANSPITNDDGSISTFTADGTESIVYPDGSMTSIDASGQTTTTDPSSDPLSGGGLVGIGTDKQSTKAPNDLLDPNASNLLTSNGAVILKS